MATVAAASVHTFTVPELVEKILLDINLTTLLKAQQVSRHFQHVILTAPAIKRKLWLEPPQVATVKDTVVFNPLLMANVDRLGIIEFNESFFGCARITLRHRSTFAALKPGSWCSMIIADNRRVCQEPPRDLAFACTEQ